VTQTSEPQSPTEQPAAPAPTKKSSRKSILALSVLAIGINSTAAVYTMAPSDFTLQNIGDFSLPSLNSLAEMIPHYKASEPAPDQAVARLKSIQSTQAQQIAMLEDTNALLLQNAALLQQDSIALASLRQSVTDESVDVKKISNQIADEHEDVKKISAKITTLISKVDTLQKTVTTPEVTSSISTRHSEKRASRFMRKKLARQGQSVGPVSLGGAPLSMPASTTGPQG
jgi:Spy/CpxP family protein refolding chaperone